MFTVWMLSGYLLFAQDLSPSVICSASGKLTNGSANVYWSLGETVIATMHSSSEVSSGFNQSSYLVPDVIINNPSIPLIRLYPNPLKDLLTVDAKNVSLKNAHFQVFDMLGNIVKEGTLQNENNINFSQLSPAAYWLKISDASNHFLPSYKIIKL